MGTCQKPQIIIFVVALAEVEREREREREESSKVFHFEELPLARRGISISHCRRRNNSIEVRIQRKVHKLPVI